MLWVAVAVALTIAWFRRPSVMPVAVIALYVGIPFAAGSGMAGGVAHPGTIVAVVALVIAATVRSSTLLSELNKRATIYIVMGAILAYLGLLLHLNNNGQNIQIETFVSPFLLVLIFRLSSHWGDVGRPVAIGLIGVALAQVFVSSLAWMRGGPIFYVEQYSAAYRWFTPDLTRALGTTDHPLVLSLLLAAAIPLLANLRSAATQVILLAVLAAGLLLTESRTGLLAGLVGVSYLTLRRGHSLGYRIAIVVGATTAAGFLLSGSLAEDVLGKFADDAGSSFVRGLSVDAFLSRWSEFVFVGWGNDGANEFRLQMGLPASLESAFLILAVNYGIVFAIIYFAFAVKLAFTRGAGAPGTRVAALIAIVLVQSFSSLGTNSASAAILWAFVGLATLRSSDRTTPEAATIQSHRPVPAARPTSSAFQPAATGSATPWPDRRAPA